MQVPSRRDWSVRRRRSTGFATPLRKKASLPMLAWKQRPVAYLLPLPAPATASRLKPEKPTVAVRSEGSPDHQTPNCSEKNARCGKDYLPCQLFLRPPDAAEPRGRGSTSFNADGRHRELRPRAQLVLEDPRLQDSTSHHPLATLSRNKLLY
jgi:hypothetical protein